MRKSVDWTWTKEQARQEALLRACARARFEATHGHKRTGTAADTDDMWGYEARCRARVEAELMRAQENR